MPCLKLRFRAYPGASAHGKPRATWGSVSPCFVAWESLESAWAVAWSMTGLTWTPGLTSISPEGGPWRKLYGP